MHGVPYHHKRKGPPIKKWKCSDIHFLFYVDYPFPTPISMIIQYDGDF